jgi:hypothetical protein
MIGGGQEAVMNYDEVVLKIKKCLALSKSSNEHEAAAALRQAQKLMEKFRISEVDVCAAGATEHASDAGAARNAPQWEAQLAGLVADAFGCDVFLECAYPKGSWCFVGVAPAPELAGYTFDVLARQLRRARADYIGTKLRRCQRVTKTRRADIFCEGWVSTVSQTVAVFARTDEEEAAVGAFMAKNYGALQTFKPLNRHAGALGRSETDDFYSGHAQGQDAQLLRPLGTQRQAALCCNRGL